MNSTLNVGMIEYLNSIPFHLAFQKELPPPCAFCFAPPTTLNERLKNNELDVSLVSSVEFLDHSYPPLAPFGIAAFPRILSVNFYHQVPLKEIQHIGVTSESATSVSLLKILCKHVWNISPRFERLSSSFYPDSFDGLLLIGDLALKTPTIPRFQTLDLAACWTQVTSLPFVFALFAVSKTPQALNTLSDLTEALHQALHWIDAHPQELWDHAHKLSKLPYPLLKTYYSLCRYELSETDLEGLSLFNKLRKDVL